MVLAYHADDAQIPRGRHLSTEAPAYIVQKVAGPVIPTTRKTAVGGVLHDGQAHGWGR